MRTNNLMERLDIESPAEFQYFEQFADMLEDESYLDEDDIYEIFSAVDKDEVTEIISNYFKEITEFLEEQDEQLNVTFELIENNLTRLFLEEGRMRDFAEELVKFKEWLSIKEHVEIEEFKTGNTEQTTLLEALVNLRLEKMGGIKYRYDFEECIDYPVEEYVMPINLCKNVEELDADEEFDDEEIYEYR